MKKNSHITITGVTGFVGSNLFEYFLDENIEINACNLRNPNWITEIDLKSTAIIHLAGIAHDLKNSSNSVMFHFLMVTNNPSAVKVANEIVEKYNKAS